MKKIVLIILVFLASVFACVEAMGPQPGEAEETESLRQPPFKKVPLTSSLALGPLTLDQEEDKGNPPGERNMFSPSIVLCGLPGSGKTSLSLALSFWTQGRMPWINQDMYGGDLRAFLESVEMRKGPIIIDKGHWTQKHRTSTRKALRQGNESILWVFLDPAAIGLEGLLMRIQGRKDGHATLHSLPPMEYEKILGRMMGELGIPTDKECPHLVTLDPCQPLEENFNTIVETYISMIGGALPKDFATTSLGEAMAHARHFQEEMTHAFLARSPALAKENGGAPRQIYLQLPFEVGALLRQMRGTLKKDYGAVHAGLSGKRYERSLVGIIYHGLFPDLRWLEKYWRVAQQHMEDEIIWTPTYFKWDEQTMVMGVKILTPACQEIAPAPIEVLLGRATHPPSAERKVAEAAAVASKGRYIVLQSASSFTSTFRVDYWRKQDARPGKISQKPSQHMKSSASSAEKTPSKKTANAKSSRQ